MKIVKLEAENFKRLKVVTIKPDGSTVLVAGKNGQGKSSTLDAIEAAFGGAKHAPDEPVRKGTKSARIVVETEKLVVTRRFGAKAGLEVKGKDGSVFPCPQAMLDSLVSSISYDPLDFVRQPGKSPADAARAQAATLRSLAKLDFTEQDDERKIAFDTRTEVTRELKRLQAQLDKMPDVDGDADETEVSVTELAAELKKRQAVNRAKEQAAAELDLLRKVVMQHIARVDELERQLTAAKAEVAELQAKGKKLREDHDAIPTADVEEVEKKLANAEAINRRVRDRKEQTKLTTELNALIEQSERLTKTIADIEAAKKKALEEAEFPVKGLEVTDEGITLDGVPFSQASQAQQLKVSVAIGLALNPELKVLLIRDGSLLDEESLAAVAKMAEEHDAQLWLEVVGNREDATVIIEDGAVAGEPKLDLCGGLDPQPDLLPAGLES